jgi:hypothetical protein
VLGQGLTPTSLSSKLGCQHGSGSGNKPVVTPSSVLLGIEILAAGVWVSTSRFREDTLLAQ